MGLFTTPLHPGCARAAANWFPINQRVLANGLITGAALLAYAVVHPVFGALVDRVDWQRAFLISGACTALLTLFWAVLATDYPWQHRKHEVKRQPVAGPAAETQQVSAPAATSGEPKKLGSLGS